MIVVAPLLPPRPSIRGSDGHEDTVAQLGLARLKNSSSKQLIQNTQYTPEV